MRFDQALVKITRLMATLSTADQRLMIQSLRLAFRLTSLAMTPAERQAKYRAGRGEIVTADESPPVTVSNENVTDGTPESSRRPPRTPRSLSRPEVVAFPGFVLFWKQYPKRVGKGEAEKSWSKSNCESKTEVILDALQKQRDFLMRDGGKFVPNPATWLNQKRWEDDPPAASMFSEKTRGNEDVFKRFVERHQP